MNSFKLSIRDFIDALKVKKYLVMFILLALVGSSVLAYTSLSYCFTPQVKRYKSISEYSDMKTNPFKVSGNLLGDAKGKLVVYIYTDYRCPICKAYNVITHRAAQEMSGFKVIHKNLPLDVDCNKYIPKPFHDGSCTMARYSIAAEDQGRFWEFNTELFEKQPKSEDEILRMAKSMGFDTIKLREDADSEATEERLLKDIDDAVSLRIDGTPTLVINGKIYSGIKPYYELKEMLIKAGAKERS